MMFFLMLSTWMDSGCKGLYTHRVYERTLYHLTCNKVEKAMQAKFQTQEF